MNRRLSDHHLKLEDSKEKIIGRYSDWAPELFRFLERDGSTVCYANLWDNWRLGAMRVAPSPAISQQFDVSLEIPLLIATFSGSTTLEPRVLRHLDTSPQLRGSTTADKDLAILVASDRRAYDFVKDRKRFAFPILVLHTDDLAEGAYRNRNLRSELARVMRSMNHFDFSNEIRQAADFYGRIEEMDSLTSLAVAGQSVGVFGLRRAGKTSLLYRVADALRDKSIDSVYIQLNAVIDADHLRETIVEGLARAAIRKGVQIPPNSEMINKDGTIRSSPAVSRRWVYEADALLDLLDEDLVVILDETDLANEDLAEFDDVELDERRLINRVLQQLRGLIQIRNDRGKRRLSFLSAGVAASIYTNAIRFGRDNQLFGFASARPLGPMSRDEMRQMVRSLGKRSGLKFDSYELFNVLYEEYGGHPHLTRQACSLIAEHAHKDETAEVPYRVQIADVRRAVDFMGEGSPAHAAWQTFQSFQRWYPGEAAIVHEVARTRMPQRDVSLITHAIGFGLCTGEGSLRMGALRRSVR